MDMKAVPQDEGWLFLRLDAVPEAWRERVVQLVLVPLLPEEAAQILAGQAAEPHTQPEDLTLMGLLAAGTSAAGIAKEMRIPVRSVHRRIARLRRAFEVETTAELVGRLARSGFGAGTRLPPTDAGRHGVPVEGNELRGGGDDEPKD